MPPPFPKTFLHGLIFGKSYWRQSQSGIQYVSNEERREYDMGQLVPKDVSSRWEKMSKTKGNIIDPLEIISAYGTDAMRMALCSSLTHAPQIDLDLRRFEEFKNFANKVWNGARFVLMNLGQEPKTGYPALSAEAFSKGLDLSLLTLEDRWILSCFNRTCELVAKQLDSYAFDQAATTSYDFFWKEFCAYYVEIVKPILFGKVKDGAMRENKQKLLVILLCGSLRLMHPMAPFITEELFSFLKERFKGVVVNPQADPYTADCIAALNCLACCIAPYPRQLVPSDRNEEVEETFSLLSEIVYAIRNIRGEMKLTPSTPTDIFFVGSGKIAAIAGQQQSIISALVPVQKIEVRVQDPDGPCLMGSALVGDLKILLPLPQEMRDKEKMRLEKERVRLQQAIEKTTMQLNNPGFVQKAPPALLEKQATALEQMRQEMHQISAKLKQLA